MRIYIPTRERGIPRTYYELPNELRARVTFVVDEAERNEWLDPEWRGQRVLFVPDHLHGIGKVRQYIVDTCTDKKLVMMDDDLTFAVRRDDDLTKFTPATPTSLIDMVSDIESELEKFAHVGVATREGGNRNTDYVVYNTRLLRVLAYRKDILVAENIRFDRLPVMEDFDVTLQLLRKGYANEQINWIVHNQAGSGKAGGCSTYRTMEVQRQGAHGLKELHPDFVSVVTKQAKTAWGGMERTDVRIQWKAAYESRD